MTKPFRLALALATLLCVSPAHAQSTKEAPAGSGQRYQGTILIDPSTGNGYAAGGGGGGSAADQTGTNATDGQATSTTNQHSVVFNYGFNGTTWDRLRVSSGSVLVQIMQGGSALSGTNGLPTTDTNAATTITPPGAAPSKVQGVQGAAGGTPVGIGEADGANVTLGAKADAAAGTGTVSAIALFKQLHLDLIAPTPAGTAIIGKVGIDQTTPGTTNKVSIGTDGVVTPSVGTSASAPSRSAETGSSVAADGIVPVVTQAGTSAVGKAAAGNLYSAYAVNGTATAGYLACINATAAPAASAAITPIDVAAIAGSAGATGQINFGAGPGNVYSAGITCLVTTSLTTYTAGGNAFIQVRVR